MLNITFSNSSVTSDEDEEEVEEEEEDEEKDGCSASSFSNDWPKNLENAWK